MKRVARAGTAVAAVFLALLGLRSCSTVLVDSTYFYPDRSYSLDPARLPSGVRHVFFETADGERIEAFHVTHPASQGRLVLAFHGNAGNVAMRVPELRRISEAGVDVLGVGYRGYGESTGSASEQGVYLDGEAALRYATTVLGYDESRIVVWGRSLGSAVALATAADRKVAGVVLVTPLSTGSAVAAAQASSLGGWLVGDCFDNLSRARRIRCPVLVIHGTDDEVIPIEHARELHEAFDTPKRFVEIPRGRHNDLERVDPTAFWGAVESFVADPASVKG
jgi:uncharacterized protein